MFLVYFERLDPGSLRKKHRDILGFFRIFAIFLVLIKICGVKGQNTGNLSKNFKI
jgi:hypothetical protein